MTKPLAGYVCLVTGASKGVGREISIALGNSGATVYITGRTMDPKNPSDGMLHHCLKNTAEEIITAGGIAHPVAVDHSDDSQVVGLFNRIGREQKGRLDLLVNNVFSASSMLLAEATTSSEGEASPTNHYYWQQSSGRQRSPFDEWDRINRVGVRNTYACCVLGSRMMAQCRKGNDDEDINRPTGVICNLTMNDRIAREFNLPYSAGKAAIDRMTLEMSLQLRQAKLDVVIFSLAVNLVKSDALMAALQTSADRRRTSLGYEINRWLNWSIVASPQLPADAIATLLPRRRLLTGCSGRHVTLTDLARQLGLRDLGQGRLPANLRSIKLLLRLAGWPKLACLVPEFIKLPYWFMAVFESKY